MVFINVICGGFLAMLSLALAISLQGDAVAMAAEDGPLEVLHLLFLAVASSAYFLAYRSTIGHWKTAAAILSVAAAAACLREFEFELVEDIPWLFGLQKDRLHWLILFVLLSPLLVHIIRNVENIPPATLLVFRRESWAICLSGLLIVAALIVDQTHETIGLSLFMEELLETYGYAFFLIAGLRHRPLAQANGWGMTTLLSEAGAVNWSTSP